VFSIYDEITHSRASVELCPQTPAYIPYDRFSLSGKNAIVFDVSDSRGRHCPLEITTIAAIKKTETKKTSQSKD
jgi:hypothetical protein